MFHFRCAARPLSTIIVYAVTFVRCPAAIAVWIFNETLKYNLWILMSCQMMPKRWFSIIINTTMPVHQPQPRSIAASHHRQPQQQQQQRGWLSVCLSVCLQWMQNERVEQEAGQGLVGRATGGKGCAARPFVCPGDWAKQMLVTLSHYCTHYGLGKRVRLSERDWESMQINCNLGPKIHAESIADSPANFR